LVMHREAFCWKEFSGNKQRGGGEARKLCEGFREEDRHL
jgi:hypothetical protein